ncbi:dienelactone hydrolase [Bradyrhizobium yuanmingense]|uniref:Dienelactone hydrolase n=2 Tax=Bradyrhizobium yuanmingense TaxID=108015 RepID=A0A0R3CMH5_9BRAD|nr:dienelactone hydrolase family protein [Bradyrhizobium yuanmingense]KRP98920.1 dienelactone hydrolase [Bradyrhizobium yuanmingense]
MSQEQVRIKAKDGLCQAWVFTPDGPGPWPSVIFYMDAFGIRPGMKQMAQHVADQGYVVLLPDLFYRYGAYGPLDPKEVLQGDFQAIVGPLMGSTDNHKAGEDTAAFLAYLDSRPDVAGKKVGTVGFCMGGGMALTAAAFYSERIAAAAIFHGGNLATDLSISPHLQATRIKGEVYIAVADNDGSYPPEMAKRFDAAMEAAGVNYRSELYAGKAHGWMKPDMPVYDAEAADRGWAKLSELYARNLR